MKYLDRLGHAAMFRSGIIVFVPIVVLAFSSTFARGGLVHTRADLGEFSLDARICFPIGLLHFMCMRDNQQGDST